MQYQRTPVDYSKEISKKMYKYLKQKTQGATESTIPTFQESETTFQEGAPQEGATCEPISQEDAPQESASLTSQEHVIPAVSFKYP